MGILLCSSVSAAVLAASPQPKIHHDNNNTGQSQYKGPQTNTTKWNYSTYGYLQSSPVIGSDGTIYFGSYYNSSILNYGGMLSAMSPNGKLKWYYKTMGEIKSSPAIDRDGSIYFGTTDDNMYALNSNGALKWKYTTGDDIYSSPAIGSDGTIYFGSTDDNLYALNPTGTLKWKYKTGDWVMSSPAIGSDGTIYFGSEDDNLYALNPNGTKKWSYNTGHYINSDPAIGSGGTIYIESFETLYALNHNGTKKWNYTIDLEDLTTSPAIGKDGTIYFGSFYDMTWDGTLHALSPNGTQKWSYNTGNYISSDLAIGSDGTIYFGSWDGNLHALNHNGTKKWNCAVGDWVTSNPAIGSDGTLYFGSWYGDLYAIADTKVTAVDPANNAVSVASNKVIKVTFSEPIKAGTMLIELKNSSGTVIPITKSISGNVLTIKPVNLLANDTKYTLILHTGSIKDYAGNSLALWDSNFSVGPVPTVKSVNPVNGAVNVPTNQVIKVTFSESVKAGSMFIELKSSNGTIIPVTASISGNVLTIKHSSLLAKGVKYSLILHTGSVTDLAGNPLAIWSSNFTTSTV